ncbi:MAG: hypothetical protein WCX64_01315 [Candidatus Micrarchaeia archaeon]
MIARTVLGGNAARGVLAADAPAFFAFLLLGAILLCPVTSAGSLLVQGALNSSSDFSAGNGSISFFVNATSGNVGVGTVSPIVRLDVNGSIRVSPDAWNNSVIFFGNASGSLKWHIVRMDYDGTLRVTESGIADRVTIQNGTGNVGIGIISPSASLQVRSNTSYGLTGHPLPHTDGTSWFDANNAYFGVENTPEFLLAKNTLYTAVTYRKPSASTTGKWWLLFVENTGGNTWAVRFGARFTLPAGAAGAQVTQAFSQADLTIGSPLTSATADYYVAWKSGVVGYMPTGAFYVDNGTGGAVDYIQDNTEPTLGGTFTPTTFNTGNHMYITVTSDDSTVFSTSDSNGNKPVNIFSSGKIEAAGNIKSNLAAIQSGTIDVGGGGWRSIGQLDQGLLILKGSYGGSTYAISNSAASVGSMATQLQYSAWCSGYPIARRAAQYSDVEVMMVGSECDSNTVVKWIFLGFT